MTEPLVDRIVRGQGWLDGFGAWVQKAVGATFGALGKPGQALKDLLHGTRILGHPLHPALTDVPIGAWVVALVADLVAFATVRIPTQAGDIALIVALVVALAAIATGLVDHHETAGHETAVATLHGILMIASVVFGAVSLALRWWASGSVHGVAVFFSAVGLGVLLLGSYLGGHLVFAIGTTVNRNAFLEGPQDFVAVGAPGDFPEGTLKRVDAGGMPALVVRVQGRLHAISATCSHAGGPLDEGTLEGDTVVCPWHASKFCLADGSLRRGPATFPQPAFIVHEQEGRVEVKLAGPGH